MPIDVLGFAHDLLGLISGKALLNSELFWCGYDLESSTLYIRMLLLVVLLYIESLSMRTLIHIRKSVWCQNEYSMYRLSSYWAPAPPKSGTVAEALYLRRGGASMVVVWATASYAARDRGDDGLRGRTVASGSLGTSTS